MKFTGGKDEMSSYSAEMRAKSSFHALILTLLRGRAGQLEAGKFDKEFRPQIDSAIKKMCE
jgi:hypothetical protein